MKSPLNQEEGNDKSHITESKDHPMIVSLLSTGLDSPVATYLMMRQGYDCHSLSFLNGKEEAELNQKKLVQIGNRLTTLTQRSLIMHFVNYDAFLDRISMIPDEKLTCILCKRNMIRTAVELAHRVHASYIVNGDILGEQASQTLDNLLTVHQVNKKIPILRPLIGFNKLDVVKLSQALELYPLSIAKGPACTYNPKFPETRANLNQVRHNEQAVQIEEITHDILDAMFSITI